MLQKDMCVFVLWDGHAWNRLSHNKRLHVKNPVKIDFVFSFVYISIYCVYKLSILGYTLVFKGCRNHI